MTCPASALKLLFKLYRGCDRTVTIRPVMKQGEEKSPVEMTGSFFTCRLFRRGFAKPMATLSTEDGTAVLGPDNHSIVLTFSREMTAKLPPAQYAMDILRDANGTGEGERQPITCGLIEVCSVGGVK